MSRARRVWFAVSAIALLISLTVGGLRVRERERGELDHLTESRSLAELAAGPDATRVSARLASVALAAGESVSFEVCSDQAADDASLLSALTFVVWRPKENKLELRVPLDAAQLQRLRRSGQRACLAVGGGNIAEPGTYALDAVFGEGGLSDALAPMPIQARVVGKRPLNGTDRTLVLLTAFCALGCALAWFRSRPEPHAATTFSRPEPHAATTFAYAAPPASTPRSRHHPLHVAPIALAFGALGFTGLLYFSLPGAGGGFVRGLLIAALEVGLAIFFARRVFDAPAAGLGLTAPLRHPGPFLLLSPLAAGLLHPLSRLAMGLVPSTGEAPIEAFISWPSGALCFALLGMTVPLAEELFFRGFVYGTLRTFGPFTAFAGSALAFSAAHAQQTWGNWGALIAVTLTGLVMTTLRAMSGSTVVPVAAHILYNLSLWRSSFQG